MNESDVAKFKTYLNEFLKICQRAIVEEPPEDHKTTKNYVRDGKRTPIQLSDGTKVGRLFASQRNDLLKTPYVNINWINLYYDWSASLLEQDKPRIYIASPKINNFRELTGDSMTTNFEFPEGTELVNHPVAAYNIRYTVQNADSENISINEGAYADILRLMKTFDRLSRLQDYADELQRDHNIIFHGAPGTGKTYLAQSIAARLLGD